MIDSSELILASVVFVHGLRGSVEKTWLHQGTGAYWPRDFLSKDLPNCRILAFGYDADIVNFWNPASKNRIGNHAENLVGALAGEREITDTVSATDNSFLILFVNWFFWQNGRSIIFIGHSLGGLVIQQALCHSKNSVEEHIQKVHECTAAIAFLGTPHFGADMAKWAAFGSQMTNTFKRSNSEIVDILKPGSEMLANIQGNFHSMLRIRDRSDKRIHITCFYEELPLPYIGEVTWFLLHALGLLLILTGSTHKFCHPAILFKSRNSRKPHGTSIRFHFDIRILTN